MLRRSSAPSWARHLRKTTCPLSVPGTSPITTRLPTSAGGGGALLSAVLVAFPHLRGMLVDRQESIDQAAPRFASEGLAARCKLLAADLCNSVPAGADVYLMKHVLHGYGDEAAIGILRNCRSVLPKTGRLLVIEFVLPDVVDHADPELEYRLMSDLNMLAVTGGKERTAGEWKALLKSSGFECRGVIPVSKELVSIIEAA
jgi:O-methyltransferase domain